MTRGPRDTVASGLRYGVCVGSDEVYRRCARRGLERLGVLDRVDEVRGASSIFEAYNSIVSGARDSVGLVLLHDDFEIRDPSFEEKVLAELASPDVAILGVLGAREPQSLKWWRSPRVGHMPDVHGDKLLGGGCHDVDVVDGALLVLSPWALRHLRFDEATFRGFHGYDVDICLAARAAVKRVRVVEIESYHHTKGTLGDSAAFARADVALRRKWRLPPDPLHVRLRQVHPWLGRPVERLKRSLRSR